VLVPQAATVGDSAHDIQAGAAVGCTTFWVQTHHTDERTQRQREKMVIAPDYEVKGLAEAAGIILADVGPSAASAPFT